MASAVDLCNRSLLQIGARAQISSINPSDGSTEGDACSVLFSSVFESLGRTAHWNCLRKQAALTLLKAAQGTPENQSGASLPLPPMPWLYSYALPSDCLKVRFIIPTLPSNGVGGIPLMGGANLAPTYLKQCAVPFQVAYDTDAQGNPITVILTNADQAQAVYTVNQQNPIIWDSLLQTAFCAALAVYLVPALSLNLPLMQGAKSAAEEAISAARAADGNEGTVSQNREASWIVARSGHGGAPCGGNFVAGYEPMAWPG